MSSIFRRRAQGSGAAVSERDFERFIERVSPRGWAGCYAMAQNAGYAWVFWGTPRPSAERVTERAEEVGPTRLRDSKQ